MSRDLKADYRELWSRLNESWDDWNDFKIAHGEHWLERAIAEKERADKYEALVRELREALNKIVYPVRCLQNEADGKNVSLDGRVATELANSSHWLKSIAKEVLGDGEVR